MNPPTIGSVVFAPVLKYYIDHMPKRDSKLGARVVGLTGLPGSGKDLSAALLSMIGFTRQSFADPLREEVAAYFHRGGQPVPQILNQAINELIEFHGGEWSECSKEVWEKPTSLLMRRILQLWGTEFRRNQAPNYWIKKAEENILGPTVFSDCRFPNEAELVRMHGGEIWLIKRPGVEPEGIKDHVSNQQIPYDQVVDNSGTALDLARNLQVAIRNYGIKNGKVH